MSGTLRLRGSTSGYAELQAAAVAGDQTFILPAVGGTLLTTDSPVGNLTLELGSASQPSLRFEGDTDTGLFSSGANTLNLVTGGSNKLVLGATAHTIYSGANGSIRAVDIDNSGNIYVNNPPGNNYETGALISNAGKVASYVSSSTSATDQRIYVYNGSTASYTANINADGSATFQGQVGIKTTNPDGTLHVHTGTAGTVTPNSGADDLVVENAGDCGISLLTADGNNTTALMFGCPTQSVGAAIRYNNSTHEMSLGPDDPDSSTLLRFNGGDGVAAMYVDSTGRLLIGTASSPAGTDAQYAKFALRGNTLNTNACYLSLGNDKSTTNTTHDDNLGIITFNDNDSDAGEYARIVGAADGANGTDDYPGKLVFATTNDGQPSPTERMIIDSAGTTTFIKKVNNAEELLFGYGTSSGIYAGIGGKNNFNTNQVCDLVFFTNSSTVSRAPSQRMKIAGSGETRIFSDSGTSTIQLHNGSTSGTTHRLLYGVHSSTSYNDGTAIYSIFTNGTVGTPSDIRLKKNVETTRDGYLDDLANLRVVKYHWKTQEDSEPKELGLIAQEVEEVFPGLIHTEGETKELKRSVIPFMLLKALQEANAKIESLETRIAALEDS